MNIYVGNLPYKITDTDMRELFAAYGEVSSVSMVKDKMTGQSKGFGFVEMPNDAEAAAAIQGLNEKAVQGRNIKVNEAKPREDRPRTGGGDRGGFQRGGDRDGGFQRGPMRESTGERANGTVKFFNDMKGFGFIQRDDGGEDVFVHISALERSGVGQVTQNDRLAFDIEVDRRGKYSATNVERLAE